MSCGELCSRVTDRCSPKQKRIAFYVCMGTWSLFTIIAASCLMAGAYRSVNLSWVDCYYGGASSSGSNGFTQDGVMSRSCQDLSNYISCNDLMDNVWNNDSLANGAGDPSFSSQWLAIDELRQMQFDSCNAQKLPTYWQAGWPTAFLYVLAFVTPVAVFKWKDHAALITTPLCLLVLLLLLTMQGPGLQDRTDGLMYWCEGLSDAVYGSCTNTVNNPNPTKDMGALPTSCYHPAIGATDWDRAIWEYKAPHLKCACDQQGDNEDKTFMSLQHAIELYDAGRWMAILSMVGLLSMGVYNAAKTLLEYDYEDAGDAGYTGVDGADTARKYGSDDLGTAPVAASYQTSSYQQP